MRGQNIQHGRARRMPWSVRTPILILCALMPVLVWELTLFGGG